MLLLAPGQLSCRAHKLYVMKILSEADTSQLVYQPYEDLLQAAVTGDCMRIMEYPPPHHHQYCYHFRHNCIHHHRHHPDTI
jgi:hypothetical protein